MQVQCSWDWVCLHKLAAVPLLLHVWKFLMSKLPMILVFKAREIKWVKSASLNPAGTTYDALIWLQPTARFQYRMRSLVDGGIQSIYSSWLVSQFTSMQERFAIFSRLTSHFCLWCLAGHMNWWVLLGNFCTYRWTWQMYKVRYKVCKGLEGLVNVIFLCSW